MIYGSDYKAYERKEQMRVGGHRFGSDLLLAAVAALLTAALRYVFIALDSSAIEDIIPPFLYSSFFGLAVTYVGVSLVLMTVCLVVNPSLVEFFELSTNRWNLLTMMGISVPGLVTAKLGITLVSMWGYYSLGYLFTICVGFAFNFQFVINYLITAYVVGLTLIFLFITVAMMFGSFTANRIVLRVFVILGFGVDVAVLYFYGIIGGEVEMIAENIAAMTSLAKPNSFLIVSMVLFLAAYALMMTAASSRSTKYQWESFDESELESLTSGKETELYVGDDIHHTTVFNTIEMNSMREPVHDGGSENRALVTVSKIVVSVLLALVLVLTLLSFNVNMFRSSNGFLGVRILTSTGDFPIPDRAVGETVVVSNKTSEVKTGDTVTVSYNGGESAAKVISVNGNQYSLIFSDGATAEVSSGNIRFVAVNSAFARVLFGKIVVASNIRIILIAISITLGVIDVLLFVMFGKKKDKESDDYIQRLN